MVKAKLLSSTNDTVRGNALFMSGVLTNTLLSLRPRRWFVGKAFDNYLHYHCFVFKLPIMMFWGNWSITPKFISRHPTMGKFSI